MTHVWENCTKNVILFIEGTVSIIFQATLYGSSVFQQISFSFRVQNMQFCLLEIFFNRRNQDIFLYQICLPVGLLMSHTLEISVTKQNRHVFGKQKEVIMAFIRYCSSYYYLRSHLQLPPTFAQHLLGVLVFPCTFHHDSVAFVQSGKPNLWDNFKHFCYHFSASCSCFVILQGRLYCNSSLVQDNP